MKDTKILIPTLLLSCLGFWSCIDNTPENPQNPGRGLEFKVDIKAFDDPSTRALSVTDGDHWTIEKFESGIDLIGFYSATGNMDAPDGNGPFENIPFYYNNKSLFNDEIYYNKENFVNHSVFFYYPYGENMSYDKNHTEYDPNVKYGLELRQKCDDGIERCLDFLYVYSCTNINTSQSFRHAFSSIIFLRGDGFKKAKNRTIKVVLDQGFSHVTVDDYTGDYLKYGYLVYLNGYEKSEAQCREWYAWKGDPFTVTKNGDEYFGVTFEDASYVILPTMLGTNRLKVDHIEIYDDND